MFSRITDINDEFKSYLMENGNDELKAIIKNYNFLQISTKIEYLKNQIIFDNMKESKIMMIKYHKEQNNDGDEYFVIGFKNTLIVIKKFNLFLLDELFQSNKKVTVLFFPDTQTKFHSNIK